MYSCCFETVMLVERCWLLLVLNFNIDRWRLFSVLDVLTVIYMGYEFLLMPMVRVP